MTGKLKLPKKMPNLRKLRKINYSKPDLVPFTTFSPYFHSSKMLKTEIKAKIRDSKDFT